MVLWRIPITKGDDEELLKRWGMNKKRGRKRGRRAYLPLNLLLQRG